MKSLVPQLLQTAYNDISSLKVRGRIIFFQRDFWISFFLHAVEVPTSCSSDNFWDQRINRPASVTKRKKNKKDYVALFLKI